MIKRIIATVIGLALVIPAGIGALYWFTFRVYVPEGSCAVLIRKTGDPLPAGQAVAKGPALFPRLEAPPAP